MNDPKRILVVVLGLIFLSLSAFGIKGHLDSDGYKKQVNYTTAIQSTKQDDFNYIVDSQQGRVLAHGTFTVKSKPAQFDEMTKGFSYVKRVQEHYTMHTSTTCSGKPVHCTTNTYYTWDEVDEQERYASTINFMGREYRPNLFNLDNIKHETDACDFTAAGTGTGLFQTKKGCIDGDFYLNDDDRYVYSIAPLSFDATFLATTYGGLKPFNEDSITLQNKSITQVLHDVGRYQLIGFWVFMFIVIILTIGATFAAYQWVMADGEWSLYK